MKKITTIVCLFCILPSLIFAEVSETTQKKNEIQLKVGMFPAMEFLIGDLVSAFSAIGNIQKEETVETKKLLFPTVSVEYMHSLSSENAIGASVSYGAPSCIMTKEDEEKKLVAITYVSAMFKYRYTYLDKDAFKLFGGVGVGGELLIPLGVEDASVMPFFSAQLTPIGFMVTGETFFGTAELTIGSEGSFITVGGGIRF